MSDLINRQAVIASIRECAEAAHSNHEWDMEQGYLNAIECIEEEPFEEFGWIPVTERLPEYGNYLISFLTDEEPDIGTYNPKTGLWSACDADGFYYVASKGLEVVAWKPLPRPYRR